MRNTINPRFRALLMSLLVLTCSNFQLSSQSLKVSEIHPVPAAGEPEWVEIFNPSASNVAIPIIFSDKSTFVKLLNFEVEANSYSVICSDTVALREARIIPQNCKLFEVKLPSLNNTTDAVVLRLMDSTVIDSAYYNMKWGFKGISLERRDFDVTARTQSNWAPSTSADSATCGFSNSQLLPNFDLAINSVVVFDSESEVHFVALNVGKQILDAELQLAIDLDRNGIFTAVEIKRTVSVNRIETGDSSRVVVNLDLTDSDLSGEFRGVGYLISPSDQRSDNDSMFFTIYISSKELKTSILINEILFEESDSVPEFVELFNTSEKPVSLKRWTLGDRPTASSAPSITIGDVVIAPRSFVVVCWDSTLFGRVEGGDSSSIFISPKSLSLNSSDDFVVLRDGLGRTVDSVWYFQNWHSQILESTKGRSLEKIITDVQSSRSSDWASCGDSRESTPCRSNSVAGIQHQGDLEGITVSPRVFSPSGLGKDSFINISAISPFTQFIASCDIYREDGSLVRRIEDEQYSANRVQFVWKGESDVGNISPSGVYVVHVRCKDYMSESFKDFKSIVVVL